MAGRIMFMRPVKRKARVKRSTRRYQPVWISPEVQPCSDEPCTAEHHCLFEAGLPLQSLGYRPLCCLPLGCHTWDQWTGHSWRLSDPLRACQGIGCIASPSGVVLMQPVAGLGLCASVGRRASLSPQQLWSALGLPDVAESKSAGHVHTLNRAGSLLQDHKHACQDPCYVPTCLRSGLRRICCGKGFLCLRA